MKKSTLLHLRIPFSFYLMPIFLFGMSINYELNWWKVFIAFIAVHLFLYPASNGYNSYFDKDEESIGGLETPPPVDKELYYASLLFDLAAILLGLLINWVFALMLLIYGLVSKAYSWDKIRLKKYAILGWLVVGLFQGAFTFLMVQTISFEHFHDLLKIEFLLPATLSSLMLWGSYPMTQIYQHKEDCKRGDQTLSRMLGIKGTFYFTGVFFSIATSGFIFYFWHFQGMIHAIAFPIFLLPVLIYFSAWFLKVNQSLENANFRSTMKLNQISAICLNSFFLLSGLVKWANI